jgi:undecaprenyl phosphate N,N'-diacetylbacillosamine 1-phosphate transferase
MTKRVFDLVFAFLLLPGVLLILIVFSIIIKLDSKGPVFFRQERLGRNRRPFRVIKLRTMVENADKLGAGLYAEKNDPRFTRAGLVLRRFSLDEFPQIFNVIAGDMSFVGPRPLPAVIVNEYKEKFDIILKVKPGITGLAQVSGRNELSRGERLKIDMFYATHFSFSLDIQILIRTMGVTMTGMGQVNYQSRNDVER